MRGGISLTPYELSKPDSKGYSVMHGDAKNFAKQRGAMRGFEASTVIRDENRPDDGGNRYFDAPTLTMLMKDKLKGRLPTEKRLVNRVATYFSTGLASMMTNPAIGLDPKSLKLADNTIVYNGANGEQVRWGQIKELTDPVQAFIDTLNQRLDGYAEFSLVEGNPSYPMLRYLGEQVEALMGGTQNKWVKEQVMEVEAPELVKTLKRGIEPLLSSRKGEETAGEEAQAESRGNQGE